jgi:SAM-dependent methyltransferase
MGIAVSALRFLVDEGKREAWCGAILTLGRQDMGFTHAQMREVAAQRGYALRDAGLPTLSSKAVEAARQFVDDAWAFRALGFDTVFVLDANAYENPTLIYDLNSANLPSSMESAFDLVLDAGTLEHIFDVPCALRTLCRVVRPGGRIIHISPASNCIDHGFYSFSPTLFADFYAANGFEILRIALARFDRNPATEDWEIEDYDPSRWGTIGAIKSGSFFLLACVRRRSTSTWDRVPQQSYYRKHAWPDVADTQSR